MILYLTSAVWLQAYTVSILHVLAAPEHGEQISLSWHHFAAFAHEARFRLRHPAVAHKARFSARFFDDVLDEEKYDNFHAEFSCCMVYTMRMKRELPLHDFLTCRSCVRFSGA